MLIRGFEFLSVIIFSIAAFQTVQAQINSTCTTLQQETGVCVPILTCQSITQLIETAPKPLPSSIIRDVRKVHCGTFNKIPHVCCERVHNTNGSNNNPTIRSSVVSTDADVQSGMAILLATQCGQRSPIVETFIDLPPGWIGLSNGKDSFLPEFPWMALLIYDDGLKRSLDCGGTLITDRYVLTAAHCIRTGLYKRLVSVRLGEHNTDTEIDCNYGLCVPPVQEIGIEEAIYHKDYRASKMVNDIGLIRLISKAVFKMNVQPICLPIRDDSKTVTLFQMTIAGWGRMVNGKVANILQKAVIPVRVRDHCELVHRLIEFTDGHLCAGSANDIETCKGDSGGPLMERTWYDGDLRWIQYGIVSAGSILCGSDYPGIYMRITSYVEWIAANIKI